MDRNAIVTFAAQLREARQSALRDAEAFDAIIHVAERLGSFLSNKIHSLGVYEKALVNLARSSALAEDIPKRQRYVHTPFEELYVLVQDARNDAVHQGAFARRLTGHSIELSLVLEDALKQNLPSPTAGDYMVRDPICAELWQPISFIRQRMLAGSFSFLPVKREKDWALVSDLGVAAYLGTDKSIRKERLALSLQRAQSDMSLQPARFCSVDTPLEQALRLLDNDQRPLLVQLPVQGDPVLVGILTAFDLL